MHLMLLLLQELRFIFPAIPLLTMAGGVGLDNILPSDSTALLYPLTLLHPDLRLHKMKKLDRQRLLTIGYYKVYRYGVRYVIKFLELLDISFL